MLKFANLISRYFGAGSVQFDTTSTVTNNIIGALSSIEFDSFKSAFERRLERLATRYACNSNLPSLLDTINRMAGARNWDGAYAEFVAFDFFNTDSNWLTAPLCLNTTVPAAETLASECLHTNANFDGSYEDCNLVFDVKALTDKIGKILEGITEEVIRILRLSNVIIKPEYELDSQYEQFAANRNALKSELQLKIRSNLDPTYIRSDVLPSLSYRILRGAGVVGSASTYNPYLHAKNHHQLLFKYLTKFSRSQPSAIISVVFPWFSERIIPFDHMNEVFYRSLCRRFFCQYIQSTQEARSLEPSIGTNITLEEVSRHLSAVIFLEDNSPTLGHMHDLGLKTFAYFNPNARHKPPRLFREHLSEIGCPIDDFQHDNY